MLVWQDLMFACAGYPADDNFLAEAAAETRHQIRRLHNHACLVLWCGDNRKRMADRRVLVEDAVLADAT